MMGYVTEQDRLAWRIIDDEAVIIHSETSDYFSLNQSGTWLWTLMDVPRTPEHLTEALSARYARPAGETRADVEAYLEQLTRAGLVRQAAEPVAPPVTAAGGAGPRDAYEPPQLVKFGNLETLILSGE